MPITLFLADDYTMVREGLRALLEAEPDFTVLGEAADGREAVQCVQQLRPDVAILWSVLPELNGIDAARMIRETVSATEVIVLSRHPAVEECRLTYLSGAKGYVCKQCEGAELIKAVRAVHAGKHYLCTKLPCAGLAEAFKPGPSRSPLERLSSREQQILQLVVESKSSVEIGLTLHLARTTVETYRSRMMTKLAIHDMPALVKFAIRHGLTTLE